jgi:hypothetical protein
MKPVHDELYCRRHAMRLASQLPDNPHTAMRVLDHMRALLGFVGGDTDDATAPPKGG